MGAKVLWLTTNSCAGDIISMLNSLHPNYRQIIEEHFTFCYESFTMAGEGKIATGVLEEALNGPAGEYIFVVEGTVPVAAEGFYCIIGHRNGKPWTALQAVKELAAKAKYVVAAGTCAAFGGPYAAHPNPIGSKPVSAVVPQKVINVPGCPVHPDWITGTLFHLAAYGEPRLDEHNRPVLYYGETIHDRCERRSYFESGIFARKPGEPWCMYKIGCKGPVTHADCPVRHWCGEHVNWPVGANTPCIGCTSPEFPDGTAPFFEHLPDLQTPLGKVTADRAGLLTGAATVLGIGAHLAANIATGRLARTLRKGRRRQSKTAQALRKLRLRIRKDEG
ncbi:MAG: hydrogenase small subunit [Bacillota bacterium]